jgi:acyl-ACP thioesterase
MIASSQSLPAVNQEQFYVSVSRGRQRCQVFTDDKERLRAHVTRSSARPAAVDVMPPASVRQKKLLWRVLQWADRVGALVRLNADLATQRETQTHQQLSHSRRIKIYERHRHGISIG